MLEGTGALISFHSLMVEGPAGDLLHAPPVVAESENLRLVLGGHSAAGRFAYDNICGFAACQQLAGKMERGSKRTLSLTRPRCIRLTGLSFGGRATQEFVSSTLYSTDKKTPSRAEQ